VALAAQQIDELEVAEDLREEDVDEGGVHTRRLAWTPNTALMQRSRRAA
jgi:hypothetical protein